MFDDRPSGASVGLWLARLDAVAAAVRRPRPAHLAVAAAVVVGGAAAWWMLRPPTAAAPEAVLPRAGEALAAPAPVRELVVHVVGAVARPGVLRLPDGGRVADAVAAAGGATLEGDTERLNLAARLVDGQRVHVPRVGEPLDPTGSEPGGGDVPAGPLNLNLANRAALESLPGIGPATAAAIVEHRERHGPFRSVDALRDVPGIGDAKIARLRPLVTV